MSQLKMFQYIKAFHSVNFSYNNYIFNVPTQCTLTINTVLLSTLCNTNVCYRTNTCTKKYSKIYIKLLRHVSVLIHRLQGAYSCVS